MSTVINEPKQFLCFSATWPRFKTLDRSILFADSGSRTSRLDTTVQQEGGSGAFSFHKMLQGTASIKGPCTRGAQLFSQIYLFTI